MLRNITLSAEKGLIDEARTRARGERKSLNMVFREWLARYVGQVRSVKNFSRLMQKLRYVQPGRRFTRDELNAR